MNVITKLILFAIVFILRYTSSSNSTKPQLQSRRRAEAREPERNWSLQECQYDAQLRNYWARYYYHKCENYECHRNEIVIQNCGKVMCGGYLVKYPGDMSQAYPGCCPRCVQSSSNAQITNYQSYVMYLQELGYYTKK